MKKILAIALTCLLVAAFAVALVACDPVEKSEKISATVEDLNNIKGLNALVKKDLDLIQEKGMLEAVKTIL